MNYLTKNAWAIYPLCILMFFSCLFTACEPDPPKSSPKEKFIEPVFEQQQSVFLLAWLADCTSDYNVSTDSESTGLDSLLSRADTRLKGALSNPILINAFGNYGVAPVWGPAIKASLSDGEVLTDNLLYAVQSQEADTITYTIGVSGTNEVSYFGWFDEDFQVEQMTPWNPPTGTSPGAISEGSSTGLEILLGLNDQSGTNILDFINGELSNGTSGTTYKVIVTGHSLGGALAPLLALYIKERLAIANLSVAYDVEAWPYAGPTPGNAGFATYLTTTLDDYHAFNNTLDVVPHAWQVDSLARLCDIYAGLNGTCFDGSYLITGGYLVDGLATWALGQSGSNDYQMAGTPVSFTGAAMYFGDEICGELSAAGETIYNTDTYPDLYSHCNDVFGQCKGAKTSDIDDSIYNFLVYLTELSYQHTTAYTNQFFTDATVNATVATYVEAGFSFTSLDESSAILDSLMSKTYQYLDTNNISNCNCPN